MTASVRLVPALVAGLLLLAPGEAAAHAFGARYDLPLPLGFYLTAAGAVVALTFAITALFAKGGRGEMKGLALFRLSSGAVTAIVWLLRALGLALFGLILAAGFLGVGSPQKNIAPLLVWVIWWVGFALFTALVGNLWPLLDPWRGLAALTKPLRGRAPALAKPGWLGSWPAVILFLTFVWAETAGGFGEHPQALAWLILVYSLIAWGWMAIQGDKSWRDHADPFTRILGYFGRFAPLTAQRTSAGGAQVLLRWPGAGLVGDHPAGVSGLLFVLLLLASVSFDGFTETPTWAGLLDWIAGDKHLRTALLWLQGQGLDLIDVITTLGLLLAPLVMGAVATLACWLAARLGGGGVSTGQALSAFALSLLPIAIAYHLAHYLSYLLIAGQLAIPIASDPFGWGWNLFGTANYTIDVGIITTKQVWWLSVAAIVTGHVISVLIGHAEALALFKARRQANLSQLPIMALMVGFTALSLWILAQPVVEVG